MWEFIDKVVYINLDHREDRRINMERFFQEGQIPSEKILRFSAIKNTPGIVGCAQSHVSVLKLAKTNNWNSILILEDDIEWKSFSENYKKLTDIIKIQFDVCILSGYYIHTEGIRVLKSYTTGAYIVKSHYYDKLINCFEESLRKLLAPSKLTFQNINRNQKIMNDHDNHFDVYWNRLQVQDNWIGIIPSMASQIESYSDILYKTYTPNT